MIFILSFCSFYLICTYILIVVTTAEILLDVYFRTRSRVITHNTKMKLRQPNADTEYNAYYQTRLNIEWFPLLAMKMSTFSLLLLIHIRVNLPVKGRKLMGNVSVDTRCGSCCREYRDQGLTRPKVLIVLPFRDSALKVVNIMMQLLMSSDQVLVPCLYNFTDR